MINKKRGKKRCGTNATMTFLLFNLTILGTPERSEYNMWYVCTGKIYKSVKFLHPNLYFY